MIKSIIQLLVTALFACSYLTANATDISNFTLEELMEVEIVSSATKMALKVNESPSAIRVITAQDIRRFGWRTLGDALATLPGITHVNDRSYDYLGTRGILTPGDYNVHHLILIDGTPLNDPVNQVAAIDDTLPLDMALIDRIEFLPGASSATYGDNALLGVINITTKSAKGRHGTELAASVDNDGRRGIRVSTAQQFDNGAALSLSVTGQRQLGRDETYPEAITNGVVDGNGTPTLDGVSQNLDRTRNKQLYVKLEQDDLKFLLIYGDRATTPSSGLFLTNFNDPELELRDRNLRLSATYSGEVARDINLYTNLSYVGYKFDGVFPLYEQAYNARYIDHEIFDSARWYGEARLTIANWHDHQTLFGLDVIQDTKAKLLNYIDGARDAPISTDNSPDARLGVYIQDDWKFAKDWQLNAGLRFDHSKINGDHTSPRLGLIWQASPTLTFKALTGRAFRNPGQFEMYGGVDPSYAPYVDGVYLNNPDLKAEILKTNELIVEWRKSNQFEFSTSLYHNQLSNMTGEYTDANNNLQKRNLYDVRTLGLEGNIHYHFANQWKLNTSLALQRSKRDDGSRLDNSASWVAKLIVDGPIWQDKLFAAYELHANGDTVNNWHGTKAQIGTTVISNLALTIPNVLPSLEMQLRINNLFDRDYTTPGTANTPFARMPAYGRNAMLRMTYDF